MNTESTQTSQLQGHPLKSRALLFFAFTMGLSFLLGFYSSKLTRNTKLFNSAQFDINTYEASDTDWVQRVSEFHSMYTVDSIEAIDTKADQLDALMTSLLGPSAATPNIPDLIEFGYSFVSLQKLVYEEERLIQLFYNKPGKKPHSLNFMSSYGKARQKVRLAREEEFGCASWRSSTQRFAIVADEPTEPLTNIANYVQKVIFEANLRAAQTSSTAIAIP